jgi:hypothetical protein
VVRMADLRVFLKILPLRQMRRFQSLTPPVKGGGFVSAQPDAETPLVLGLFESNISFQTSQDKPGERQNNRLCPALGITRA